MRRAVILMVGAALAVSMFASPASAADRSKSQSYNAFWHIRTRVDRDTYLRITWYAGVYATGEDFWSDLYRSTQVCERGSGRDRCRSGPYLYGVIDDLGDGTFELDRGLDSGTFVATYPMEVYRHGDERDVGDITIEVGLVGEGSLSTGSYRERYTNEEGCTQVYSSRWEYRQAIASGVLTFERSGETRDIGDTDDANMGRGNNLSISHGC